MNTLILGGIKSGKTLLAEQLALRSGKSIVLIVTADVARSAGDAEMSARIEKHKKSRPQHWTVIEEPRCIGDEISKAKADEVVIVDCLTLWLTNLLDGDLPDNSLHENSPEEGWERLKHQQEKLLHAIQSTSAQVILVSNETSMGIIPMGELTRRFCDEAGVLHQRLSTLCDQVILCVAGLPHVLKDIPVTHSQNSAHEINRQQASMTDQQNNKPDTSAQHKIRMQKMQKQQKERVAKADIERGILIVNTGDGKGKSSSAFGTAIRAAGHGQKVCIMQFIKGTWKTGEAESFKRFPEIDHIVSGDGFTWNTQDLDEDTASARHGWNKTVDMIEQCRSDNPLYDLIVLDELNIALRYEYLDIKDIVSVLGNKPDKLNIIVTGRDAKPELIALADTVTDMTLVKHAFEAGIRAQKGVEF